MSKRHRITLATQTHQVAEWTTSDPVTNESQFAAAWRVVADLATVLGHKPQEKSYKEAGFVQAFLRSCFFCGGTVKPDGKGGYICQDCGRYQ